MVILESDKIHRIIGKTDILFEMHKSFNYMLFMKSILFLSVILSIAGCKPDFKIVYPHIIYYGDSLCSENYSPGKLTATERLGIPDNCIFGRPMRDVSSISSNYSLAFLGMGTNDARLGVSMESFSQHLNNLLTHTEATVVCVIPNLQNKVNVEAVRAEMLNQCINVIDPQKECGVGPRFIDGLHYTEKDHAGLAGCLKKAISDFDQGLLL